MSLAFNWPALDAAVLFVSGSYEWMGVLRSVLFSITFTMFTEFQPWPTSFIKDPIKIPKMLTILVRDRYPISFVTICYHTLIAIHSLEILIMYIYIRHGVSHYWTSHAKLFVPFDNSDTYVSDGHLHLCQTTGLTIASWPQQCLRHTTVKWSPVLCSHT